MTGTSDRFAKSLRSSLTLLTLATSALLPPRDAAASTTVIVPTTAANIPYSGAWPGGVDMATNELFFAEPPDLCLGGPLPLCFGRYYASLLDREGMASGHVGTNWLGTYDWKLTVNGPTARIVDDRGEILLFTQGIPGSWIQANHFEETNTLVVRALDNMHRLHRSRQRRTYEFDGSSGLLRKILDEHGNSLTCSYAGGLLGSVGDGLGRTLTFGYDALDRLVSAGDGTRSVSYGHVGNLLSSFTDAAGHTTTYAYAPGPYPGLLVSGTTPIGTTPVTYAYDPSGKVMSETDAFTNVWAFGVGPGGGCVVTTPTGDLWESFHDGELRLGSLHDPLGGTTSWTYDPLGRPASVTRPVGDVTTLGYDPASGFPSDLGRADGTHVLLSYAPTPIDGFDVFHLTGASYPDGASESFSYDAAGNLVTHTDRAGKNWTATYNPRGQLLTGTNPASGVTTLTYDPMLRLASRTDHAGNTTSFTYDALDRLVHVAHPDETGRDYAYDALDRLIIMTDERGKVWSRAYDDHGRLLSRTDPLGHAVGFAYDAMDRVTGVTDALGKTRTDAYDALGRLTSATDRTSRTTTYAYDALGRLVQRTDPGDHSTQFGYDANGRLLTATDPLAHAMTYEYDALDRVTRATDPLENAVDYGYDAMGRLTSADAPLGQTRAYGYDARGLLVSLLDVTSEAQLTRTALGEVGSIRDPNLKLWPFAYDPQGRPTSRTDPLARSTSLSYDSRSRLSHVATPVGSGDFTYDPAGDYLECQWLDAAGSVALSYAYDDARRLTAATGATFAYDAADRLVSSNGLSFTHDDEGRLSSETYAPGKTVTYAYDARGLLSGVSDWLGGTTSFTYDAAGRLTGITRPNGTAATYEYDAANRLIHEVEIGPGPPDSPPLVSITLSRDELGRIASGARVVPLEPGPTSSESNAYAYDDASQIVGFGFDGMGRLLSDGTRSFEWDAAGRLAHYAAGAESPTFTYDAFGRMLTRTDGAMAQQFVWDYANGVPSLDRLTQGPTSFAWFVHTPGGTPLYRVDASDARTFYHYDEAGNTIFLTDGGGSVIASYAYSPTGETRSLGATADNPFTFAGALGAYQEREAAFSRTGSMVFENRIGRCISCPASALDWVGMKPGPPNLPVIETTGIAEILGNDAILGAGAIVATGLFGTGEERTAVESGTLFHEIGHSLGLRHGGTSSRSGGADVAGNDAGIGLVDKVNYISVMDYRYQIGGIDITDPHDGASSGGVPGGSMYAPVGAGVGWQPHGVLFKRWGLLAHMNHAVTGGGTTGQGEVAGEDATISLAEREYSYDDGLPDPWEVRGGDAIDINCDGCEDPPRDRVLQDSFAGTLMHEFGHNLWLCHDGVCVAGPDDTGPVHVGPVLDGTLDKVHHLSVMDYRFQIGGIDITDPRPADPTIYYCPWCSRK
ncbi:MAG TPA: DUF6531 domain-containing protein [Candidatus Eisenbacteria bacterium]|jgi:YD repeat-containing protein